MWRSLFILTLTVCAVLGMRGGSGPSYAHPPQSDLSNDIAAAASQLDVLLANDADTNAALDSLSQKIKQATAFREEILSGRAPNFIAKMKEQDRLISEYRAEIEDHDALFSYLYKIGDTVEQVEERVQGLREEHLKTVAALQHLRDEDAFAQGELRKIGKWIESQEPRIAKSTADVTSNEQAIANIGSDLADVVSGMNDERAEVRRVTLTIDEPSAEIVFPTPFANDPAVVAAVVGYKATDLPESTYGYGSSAGSSSESIYGFLEVSSTRESVTVSLNDHSNGYRLDRANVVVAAYDVDNQVREPTPTH